MPGLDVLTTADRDRWLAILAEIGRFDFYHLPQYHELAERMGDGQGRLLVYRREGHTIALPLMFRPCSEVEGLEGEASQDASSVYGYAGPLASSPMPPVEILADFRASVHEQLTADRVAAVFSRLNPLFEQEALIDDLGDTLPSGTTVSIDLTVSTDEQLAQYRSNHTRGLRKLRNQGVSCELEQSDWIDEFVEIYHETMRRVGAAPRYFFDRAYFEMLEDLLGPNLRLFACRIGDQLIAAGLFFVCGDIVQYHLGATRTEYVALGPMKLTIDTCRQWATEAGFRLLHLGGGLAAKEDSLFDFKAGFSNSRHEFKTWRWAPDLELYSHLTTRKAVWNVEHGLEYASSEYFPLYRSRVTSIEDATAGAASGLTTGAGVHDGPPPDRSGHNVLITAAGRRTSLVLAFAAETGRRGGRVLAADMDPLAPALFLADEAVRLRATTDPGYPGEILSLVKSCGVSLLVPTIDPDLPILAQLRGELRALGCIAAVSNEAFVAIAADKLATVEALGGRGVTVPELWLVGDRPGGWPETFFVKPRRGSASQGARVARRRDVDTLAEEGDTLIAQEILTGQEVTIDALLDFDGRPIHYVPRARIRTLGGELIEGVTLDHDRTFEGWIENILGICGSLGAAGPICLQAFLTNRGPVLSEINARFRRGLPLEPRRRRALSELAAGYGRGETCPGPTGRLRVGVVHDPLPQRTLHEVAALVIWGLVLDLDDTLYLERDYVYSGFHHIARLAAEVGVDDVDSWLIGQFDAGTRGDTFDRLLVVFPGLQQHFSTADLVTAYRRHQPAIALLPGTEQVIVELKDAGCRLGILS